ncbi:GIY-YIG nuclease family protein [Treponema brennaborense]|uniref:DUF4357 domain-containing protein n=1 Tax=Treponema brennaborense (strain DSM 12168 / CIP 105900 / DD5/3) TaxID=906968 RepID=F4LNX9_TREBD|nr:GIY-YIG nuclease family protein [Treponema brennaborense]AEE17956.1 hypothetical protein Trebr_2552 [Treponema brennaborense DSM 12168]
MAGKTIKLYITGDEQKNLKSAELSNWTGKAYIGERKHVPAILKIEEISNPGIYFLINQEQNSIQKTIYIGEADEVNTRLKNHITGKDWWDSFVVFISKDANLTKAHVRYLEKRFYQIAKANTTAFNLRNLTEPPGSKLPYCDIDDLEEYLNNMIFILQNLGLLDFAKTDEIETPKEDNTNIFYIALTAERTDQSGNQLKGMLQITKSGYRLLKGSYIEKNERESFKNHCYYPLRKKIETERVFKNCDYEGVYILDKDIDFNSSSAAASIVKARATNGPKEWKLQNGMTLDAWETKEF